MEDRYSVLITLVNQFTSDGFYCSFNGKRFRPSEVPDFLHLYVELCWKSLILCFAVGFNLDWCGCFVRLRSATYILLSLWCAVSSKKRPLCLPMDSLNCQLVLFVLVSIYKLVIVHLCSIINQCIVDGGFGVLISFRGWRISWLVVYLSYGDLFWCLFTCREIGPRYKWNTENTVWPFISMSLCFEVDVFVLSGWFILASLWCLKRI